jgi:purine-binding chemotaxis protein CheW
MQNLILCLVDQKKIAFDLAGIERVERVVDVTPMPQKQPFMMGVINFHGQIVSVVSLRSLLGVASRELCLSDLFLIYSNGKKSLALWVDSIADLTSCSEEKLLPAQDVLPTQPEFIRHVMIYENEIVPIYDLSKIIASEYE